VNIAANPAATTTQPRAESIAGLGFAEGATVARSQIAARAATPDRGSARLRQLGSSPVKLRLVRLLQRRLVNPPIKLLFRLGFVPPGYALLETVGRRSGQPRQTPVGDGLVDETFWIVAEHGLRAAYVRNLQAHARVRVQVRQGRRMVWRRGIARVVHDDDARERQRWLARTSLNRRLNAFVVRAMGTELATVRIDLDG